ncbi:tetratricopeptide repeat protein [Deinococcus sp.]|uniref:tetratricopeptide repeat protein n=1 Tax=Deinococcus sp. TaxID=47478 RepID=UPI0025C4799C|nr:tetratricopeptide repeat protein [Deinococcus sp.]
MHPSPSFPQLTRVLIAATLVVGTGARAQTLTDTSAAMSGQNILNSTGAPNSAAVLQHVRQAANSVKAAEAANTPVDNGLPTKPPADAAPVATVAKPAVEVTPLTTAEQAALLVAQNNLKAGRYPLARSQFEALVAQHYNNPEPHFGLALALLAQKDDKGAVFELTQFQAMAPDRYEGPYNLGVIATRAGRYADALKFYTDAAALAKDKTSPVIQAQILDALAGEQTRKADFAGLSATLSDLNVLRPGDASVQFRLAQAQTLSGNGTQALPGLYALIQKQPERADAVNLVADIYVTQGLADRALRELDAAISRAKTGKARSALLLHKADILAGQGDTRAAVFSAQAAHVQDPSNVDAYSREADLRLSRNDRSGALEAYQNALKLTPKNARIRTNLAALRLAMGQTAQAGQDAELALKSSPDKPTQARAQFLQGVALYRGGQYAQAKTLLNASALNAPSAETTLWLGLANYALKDYPSAVAALSESIKLKPSVPARQNLASALLAAGRYPEAEAVLKGLVTDNAKSGEAWYLLGLAQRGQMRAEDARASWKTAANLGDVRAKEALK